MPIERECRLLFSLHLFQQQIRLPQQIIFMLTWLTALKRSITLLCVAVTVWRGCNCYRNATPIKMYGPHFVKKACKLQIKAAANPVNRAHEAKFKKWSTALNMIPFTEANNDKKNHWCRLFDLAFQSREAWSFLILSSSLNSHTPFLVILDVPFIVKTSINSTLWMFCECLFTRLVSFILCSRLDVLK